MLFHLIVIAISLAGFAIAFYIGHHKRVQKPLVCPLNFDCSTVIHSKYSTFLGIPVEKLGLCYYGATAVLYTLLALFSNIVPPIILFAAAIATTAAVMFSLYLTFIQMVVIKQWCSWCLFSAALCIGICVATLPMLTFEIIPLLGDYHYLIVVAHLLAAGIGLGVATTTDILFFKFLKDFTISEKETEVLHTLSQVIWLALAILIITGIGLYLPMSEVLNHSAKFLTKVLVVLIITINGLFLNLVISPNLINIFSGEGRYLLLRKIAFALGAVSMVSWYTAFILGALHNLHTTMPFLISLYATLLAVAVGTSQVVEYFFSKNKPLPPSVL